MFNKRGKKNPWYFSFKDGLIYAKNYLVIIILYFASIAQPGTQSNDTWARWPAKPPCHWVLFHNTRLLQNRSEANILTHVSYFQIQRDELKASADDANQTFQVGWIIFNWF